MMNISIYLLCQYSTVSLPHGAGDPHKGAHPLINFRSSREGDRRDRFRRAFVKRPVQAALVFPYVLMPICVSARPALCPPRPGRGLNRRPPSKRMESWEEGRELTVPTLLGVVALFYVVVLWASIVLWRCFDKRRAAR